MQHLVNELNHGASISQPRTDSAAPQGVVYIKPSRVIRAVLTPHHSALLQPCFSPDPSELGDDSGTHSSKQRT